MADSGQERSQESDSRGGGRCRRCGVGTSERGQCMQERTALWVLPATPSLCPSLQGGRPSKARQGSRPSGSLLPKRAALHERLTIPSPHQASLEIMIMRATNTEGEMQEAELRMGHMTSLPFPHPDLPNTVLAGKEHLCLLMKRLAPAVFKSLL